MTTREAQQTSRPAAVYRLWDAEGNLLYIGSAYDPEERCKEHRDKPWWPLVARRTEDWHPHRTAAYHAESAAIAEAEPPHNHIGTSRYVTPATDGKRRAAELSRARGRVQSAAYRLDRQVRDGLIAQGRSLREAHHAGRLAYVAYLDASGMFAAYVERLRDRQRTD